ncbi:MAG: precorrin-4 C(11)-methyltransferase [Bacteroidaceae bacterium]|nr:precorrin-4 C(11)-methyltransferase [Bacteroidaceae bacterium]
MQKIAIIQISEEGSTVARQLQAAFKAENIKRTDVAACWHDFEAFVFIGAMGICVRTIASLVEDKHTDPAVVCVDSLGTNVISVLSGHIGGANELTLRLSSLLHSNPVITTQSDLTGLWPLDTLATRFNWVVASQSQSLNPHIVAFINRQPTALLLETHDDGTDFLLSTLPPHVTLINDLAEVTPDRFRLLIIVSPRAYLSLGDSVTEIPVLHFVPHVATLGFGLAHQAQPAEKIYDAIQDSLTAHDLHPACIREWCTIDVKADEPFVALLRGRGEQVRFFTADELSSVSVPNPSPTVQHHVGTPSVSEAAALLASHGGPLILEKQKGENWTLAIAIDSHYLRPDSVPGGLPAKKSGHIEIVGAGPGDPELISVRGRRFLEQADLILYAGSLVPKALTECHKPGAVVRSSADMALEEQCTLMKEHYDRGHLIVRLHTGDPCIFGAIQEQMAFFDEHGMKYHITPGISSFLAAAAELRSQFTIPERTQTIILTRGEGRTPMPEREKLHLLARSRSTMCIFLSAAIVDDVQRELLQEYPEDTPVAACYHLTWPDQHIYRGQLKDLARIVHDNHLTLTTMLVVGEAIDNRAGFSELYNRHFTHLFRKGE